MEDRSNMPTLARQSSHHRLAESKGESMNFKEAKEKVFQQHADLFRKLAEAPEDDQPLSPREQFQLV